MRIDVKTNPELYGLIAKEADKRGISMGRLLVALAAQHFRREDLDFVPRKKMGRPRKTVTNN